MTDKPYANADVEAAAIEVRREFSDAFSNLDRYLRDELAKLNRDGQILTSDTFNIQRIREIVGNLQAAADAAGYGQAIDGQSSRVLALADSILKEAGDSGLPVQFTKTTGEGIQALLQGIHHEALAGETKLAADLERLLVRSAVGGTTWSDLIANLKNILDGNERQATTAAMNALASFHTIVRTRHFEDAGVEWFLYDGPADDLNRPFCEHFVGTRVTSDILDRHSEDFKRNDPMPASVSLGGFNCRHELVPLTEPSLLEQYPVGPEVG